MKYHCFISYTNRESEIRELSPLLDAMGSAFRSVGIIHAPFFWDRFQLGQQDETRQLAFELLSAIRESVCMLAFVSPGYMSSPWCIFEWGAMSGVQLCRGPQWPALKPYVWKPVNDLQQFVGQVPYQTVSVDLGALVKYRSLPWRIRNPFGEHLFNQEKRKCSVLIGDALCFIAAKCREIDPDLMGRDLIDNSKELYKISDKLSRGWDVEDVAQHYVWNTIFQV